MKLLQKLLLGQVLRHPARFLLTTLAIIAASVVVIWVVSGYDSLVAQFDQFADDYVGRYQYVLVTAEPPNPKAAEAAAISANWIAELARDPAVRAVDAEVHLQAKVRTAVERKRGRRPDPTRLDPRGARAYGPPPPPTVVFTSAAVPPYPLVQGRWFDGSAERAEGVIGERAAGQHQIELGSEVTVETDDGQLSVLIVGVVEQVREIQGAGRFSPNPTRGPALSPLYLPISQTEPLTSGTQKISIAPVELHQGAEEKAFLARWSKRLAEATPSLELISASDVQSDLESSRAAEGVRNQAYSATGLALLAALFIIFTALSMGVHERARQFAVLRAVALTPRQIAALVMLESLLLGVIGWLGGLAAGWGLLSVMSRTQPDLFTAAPSLGRWCIGLSFVCAIGGALAAAVFPAWRAMRISPMDAINAPPTRVSPRLIRGLAIGGGLLILINPLLVFAWPSKDGVQYPIYVAVGCSAMAIGFLWLTPWAIVLVEKGLGPWVSRLLRLEPRLLASELSANVWRSLGTCAALTLGLGLFVATQVWGFSMLQPFVPGQWVPDVLVNFTVGDVPEAEFRAVAGAAGMRSETLLPLAVEQARLAEDLTDSAERASVARQDNVILIGLDPQRGIGATDALLDLRFVAGSRAAAAAAMATGRGCVIPDHFAREAELEIGDTFELLPPESPDYPVQYEVAGIVELPGWHWMTKFSGLRRRSGRAAAIVFADWQTVRSDFALEQTQFYWGQLQPGASVEKLGGELEALAARFPGPRQPVNPQGMWTIGAIDAGDQVRLSTPQVVQQLIANRASGMIWGMSQLPLVTLAIAALGVLNTIMASIRARTWSIGVMRAVGLSRSSLARLILAESLLLGLVACVVSLGFGLMAGWCGAGISQYVSFFGGLNPSLVIPWRQLAWAMTATLVLCLLAALWPALRAARREPLELLQAGRAAL